MSLVERIRSLAKEKGTTIKALERELGIGNGTIRGWDQSSPSAIKLLAVANHLDTSTDFLLTGSAYIPKPYAKLIKTYTSLPPEDRARIDEYMRFVSDCEKIRSEEKIKKASDIREKSTYNTGSAHHIPILGYVAAGVPIHSENVPLGNMDIDSNQKVDYALIAKGFSMEPIIKNGDYIFVQRCDSLQPGEIGIFYIDEEVTCKKFYAYADHIELKSLNPDFSPLKIPADTQELRVQGKVILTQEQQSRM